MAFRTNFGRPAAPAKPLVHAGNPFAQLASERGASAAAGANPFAQPTATAGNPFAQATASNPFAQSTAATFGSSSPSCGGAFDAQHTAPNPFASARSLSSAAGFARSDNAVFASGVETHRSSSSSSSSSVGPASGACRPTPGWFPLVDAQVAQCPPSPFATHAVCAFACGSSDSSSSAATVQPAGFFGLPSGPRSSPFAPRVSGTDASSAARHVNPFGVSASQANGGGSDALAAGTSVVGSFWHAASQPLTGTHSIETKPLNTAASGGQAAPVSSGFTFTFTPSWQPKPTAEAPTPASGFFALGSEAAKAKKSEFMKLSLPAAQQFASSWTCRTFSSGLDASKYSRQVEPAMGFDAKLTNDSLDTGERSAHLVALPDLNPYGEGAFGSGRLEAAVKAALSFQHSCTETADFLSRSSKPKPKATPNHTNFGLSTRPLSHAPLKLARRMTGERVFLHRDGVRRRVRASGRGIAADSNVPQLVTLRTRHEFLFKSSLVQKPSAHADARYSSNKAESSSSVVETSANGQEESTGEEDRNVGGDEKEGKYAANPACPILTTSHVSTVPEYSQLQQMSSEDLASVDGFAVHSAEFGEIEWPGVTDLRNLDLDKILSFSDAEVVVYPEERTTKPSVGAGLNKRAILRLAHIYPSNTSPSNDGADLTAAFVERLKKRTADLRAKFLGYEPSGGVWMFQVEHF